MPTHQPCGDWHSWGNNALSPFSLPPAVGGRIGPGIIRKGELVLPLTDCSSYRRAGPTSCLGSTIELTLWSGAEVRQSCEHETWRAAPASSLICHLVPWVGEIRPLHYPLPIVVGGRAGLEASEQKACPYSSPTTAIVRAGPAVTWSKEQSCLL